MSAVREGEILAGKYRVERVLGEGGMGVVVAATHLTLDERVALKFMLPGMLADANAAKRFVREAKAAVKLKSEHVAKVLDVGTLEDGAPYIVMEYLEGDDLGKILERRGRLPLGDVADYVIQACDAIAEAHVNGIVHRDLKPSNLFVTQRGDGAAFVKVLDFGISKATALGDSGLVMTKSNAMLGSPLYMSPEQMKSSRDVDARADVWSLGVIMFELSTNSVPFDGESVGALMAKVLTEKPPWLQTVRSDLPDDFARLVESCLQNDVSKRCPDVAEIALALAPYAPKAARILAERIEMVVHGSKRLRVAIASASARPPSATLALDQTQLLEQAIPASPQLPRITSSAWEGTPAKAARRPIVYLLGAAALCAVLGGAAVGVRALNKEPAAAAGLTPTTTPLATTTASSTTATAATSTRAAPATSASAPEPAAAVASSSAAAATTATAPAQQRSATAAAKPPAGPSTTKTASPAPSGSAKKKGVLDSWD